MFQFNLSNLTVNRINRTDIINDSRWKGSRLKLEVVMLGGWMTIRKIELAFLRMDYEQKMSNKIFMTFVGFQSGWRFIMGIHKSY